MIVQSMNEDQQIAELDADLVNVIAISDEKDKKVARIVRKASIFPIFLHSFVTTKRKNKWMILWEAKSRKNVGELSLITLVCYYDTDHGKYAAMYLPVQNNKRVWALYTPHFFQRFAKRMNLNLTGTELMKRYFEKNNNYGLIFKDTLVTEDKYVREIYANSAEGSALGLVHPGQQIFLLKTFISYEMCKGSQIEEFAKSNTLRAEIHEKEISSLLSNIPNK